MFFYPVRWHGSKEWHMGQRLIRADGSSPRRGGSGAIMPVRAVRNVPSAGRDDGGVARRTHATDQVGCEWIG